MTFERLNKYKNEVKSYWNSTYLREGYSVVHDAGSYEKTLTLADREIDLFLYPTIDKINALLNDREYNPYPTFTENYIKHQPIVDLLKKPLNECVVLDYGCGSMARYSRALSKHFKKVIGVDVSDVAIFEAMQAVHDDNIKNVQLLVNDGTTIPAKNNSLDMIFSNLVFQHIGNKEILLKLVSEMERCLVSGGVVRAEYSDPTDKKDDNWESPYHGNGFDIEEIRKVYNDRGFDVLTITPDYHLLWITAVKK